MLLYLNMCSLHRPLDDKTQLRIALEAEAVLGLLAPCQAGAGLLLSSEALEYEAARNPHPLRKAHTQQVLARAVEVARLSDEIEQLAKAYYKAG